jgi:hypothetical protein
LDRTTGCSSTRGRFECTPGPLILVTTFQNVTSEIGKTVHLLLRNNVRSCLKAVKHKPKSHYDLGPIQSWCQTPSGAQDHVSYCWAIAILLIWRQTLEEPMGLSFTAVIMYIYPCFYNFTCHHRTERQAKLSSCINIRIYKTIILPVVLYGCETWSLALQNDRRLKVFENKVLRRIFEPKRLEKAV